MSDFSVKPGEITDEQHQRILNSARFLAKSLEDMGCERPVIFYAFEAKRDGQMQTFFGRAFDRTSVSESAAKKNYELIGELFEPQEEKF